MDHSENDKRFYVYVHKDSDGSVIYVGHGTRERITSKTARSGKHLEMWDSLEKIKLYDGLSKSEAFDLEVIVLQEHINTVINKRMPKPPRKIGYLNVSQYVYYDETSSTFLRRKTDRIFRDGSVAVSAHSECGSKCNDVAYRYSEVFINGRMYKAHRIIYALHNGCDLDSNMHIDHIDGDTANNNINNLRLVTPSANALNKTTHRDRKIDLGITWKSNGKTNWYWTIQWRENFKVVSKYLNPITLFPELPFEEAKQKAFELAVEFRKNKELELTAA